MVQSKSNGSGIPSSHQLSRAYNAVISNKKKSFQLYYYYYSLSNKCTYQTLYIIREINLCLKTFEFDVQHIFTTTAQPDTRENTVHSFLIYNYEFCNYMFKLCLRLDRACRLYLQLSDMHWHTYYIDCCKMFQMNYLL